MKFNIKTFRLQIVFTTMGAIGGFLYWKFVGCNNGSCAIKSVWYWSTLWGASVGFLMGDFIYGFIKKKKKEADNNDECKVP